MMLKRKCELRKTTNEEQQQNQHHKNLQEVLPSKYYRWEFLTFVACDHYNKTYVIYIICIIYVIHNFNYL